MALYNDPRHDELLQVNLRVAELYRQLKQTTDEAEKTRIEQELDDIKKTYQDGPRSRLNSRRGSNKDHDLAASRSDLKKSPDEEHLQKRITLAMKSLRLTKDEAEKWIQKNSINRDDSKDVERYGVYYVKDGCVSDRKELLQLNTVDKLIALQGSANQDAVFEIEFDDLEAAIPFGFKQMMLKGTNMETYELEFDSDDSRDRFLKSLHTHIPELQSNMKKFTSCLGVLEKKNKRFGWQAKYVKLECGMLFYKDKRSKGPYCGWIQIDDPLVKAWKGENNVLKVTNSCDKLYEFRESGTNGTNGIDEWLKAIKSYIESAKRHQHQHYETRIYDLLDDLKEEVRSESKVDELKELLREVLTSSSHTYKQARIRTGFARAWNDSTFLSKSCLFDDDNPTTSPSNSPRNESEDAKALESNKFSSNSSQNQNGSSRWKPQKKVSSIGRKSYKEITSDDEYEDNQEDTDLDSSFEGQVELNQSEGKREENNVEDSRNEAQTPVNDNNNVREPLGGEANKELASGDVKEPQTPVAESSVQQKTIDNDDEEPKRSEEISRPKVEQICSQQLKPNEGAKVDSVAQNDNTSGENPIVQNGPPQPKVSGTPAEKPKTEAGPIPSAPPIKPPMVPAPPPRAPPIGLMGKVFPATRTKLLRPVYCQSIKDSNALKNSMWAVNDEMELRSDDLSGEEIMSKFKIEERGKKKAKVDPAGTDSDLGYNISTSKEISLEMFFKNYVTGMPGEDLFAKYFSIDEKNKTNFINELKGLQPVQLDIDFFAQAKKSGKKFTQPSLQRMAFLCEDKNYSDKLEVLKTINEIEEQKTGLLDNMRKVIDSCKKLESSHELKTVLLEIVKIINFINVINSQERIKAFSLTDTLPKLSQMKSTVQSDYTLLNTLVAKIQNEKPDILPHLSELCSGQHFVPAAGILVPVDDHSRSSTSKQSKRGKDLFSTLTAPVKLIDVMFNEAKACIARLKKAGLKDSEFLKKAEERLAVYCEFSLLSLNEQVKEMQNEYDKLMCTFAQDRNTDPGTFFSVVNQFVLDLLRTRQQNMVSQQKTDAYRKGLVFAELKRNFRSQTTT